MSVGLRMRTAVVLGLVGVLSACGGGASTEPFVTTPRTEAPTTTIDPILRAIAEGKIAICNGGGTSDNTEFDKTCSSQDGVDEWLAPYGECNDGTIIEMSSSASCGDGFKGLLPKDFVPTTTSQPSGPPEGAVARCNNGDFSDNTDFYATCSSADGVDEWLAPYGECNDGTVVTMSKSASCSDHDGFRGLLPVDYVPTTTTTATPTFEAQLTQSIDDELDRGELGTVEVLADRIVVTVRSDEGLTEGFTKDNARFSVAQVLEGSRNAGLPPEVGQVSVIVLYPLLNEFGEISEEKVIEADYTRATVDRIVFENIDERKILPLADAYLYVHPAMAKGDGS